MLQRWSLLASLSLIWFALPNVPAAGEAPPGFEPLFNGKDLTGWQVVNGKKDAWSAENGLLVVKGQGGGWLMTEKEYADFELMLEYKLVEKGNSGVALRSPLGGRPSNTAMEIQILDDAWHKVNYKGLKRTQLTGSIYDVVPPSVEVTKPIGEWNQMRITAKGRHITVELNGTKIVDANLDDYKDRFEQHPGLLRTKGHLGLQSHNDRVEFRSLYVKPL
jgi:hypothetical protein